MTSFVPVYIGNDLVPIKFGGKTKDEPSFQFIEYQNKVYNLKRLKPDERWILRTPEVKKLVFDTSVEDVRSAYLAWIPMEYADKIPDNLKSINIKLPDGSKMALPIKKVTKWSRGSKAIWFEGQPLLKLDKKVVEDLVKEGASMVGYSFGVDGADGFEEICFDGQDEDIAPAYTLKRELRKKEIRPAELEGVGGSQINIDIGEPQPDVEKWKIYPEKGVACRAVELPLTKVKPTTYRVEEKTIPATTYYRGGKKIKRSEYTRSGGEIERKGYTRKGTKFERCIPIKKIKKEEK